MLSIPTTSSGRTPTTSDSTDPQAWLLGRVNRLYSSSGNSQRIENYTGKSRLHQTIDDAPAALAANEFERETRHVLESRPAVAESLESWRDLLRRRGDDVTRRMHHRFAGHRDDDERRLSRSSPILLTSAPTTLDVFPVGEGKLDPGS